MNSNGSTTSSTANTRDGAPRTSLAAVFVGAGQALELRELSVPDVAAGEVLVRIDCCTLCGSDLHTIRGTRREETPSILGHEAIGEVIAAGSPPLADVDGAPLAPGDRVTWSVAIACGACDRCAAGIEQKCRKLAKYGHTVAKGRAALSGGLAEIVLLRRGTAAVKLPTGVPDEVLCPANCATATIAAAFRSTGLKAGDRVLILGAGMLGLTAAAFARDGNAATIALCDTDAARLERAADFGASHGVLFVDDFVELQARVREATGCSAFDAIVEASGAPAAVEAAVRLGDIGARVALVGSVLPSRRVEIDPESVVRRLLTITGVHNYAPGDLRAAVDFLERRHGDFPFASLAKRVFPLEDVNTAVDTALRERPIRVVVKTQRGRSHARG